MNLDFIGYTGKTGSIIYNYLKNQYNFKNLVNSKNYESYQLSSNTIVIDFSSKEFILRLIKKYQNPNPLEKVIYLTGVTGLEKQEFEKINQFFQSFNIIGYHFPNFSVGINLINQFVKKVSLYFNNCEIVEMHHHTKKDKPSGTSIMTSNIIKQTWKEEKEVIIHSVRLPSLVAHQTVIFSNELGEVLEITHHSLNRLSFAYGVKLVVDKFLSEFPKDKAGFYFNLNLFDIL